MNSEYIPFVDTLTLRKIDGFLRDIGIEYTISNNSSFEQKYKGVSDGRFVEANTICFVDKELSEYSAEGFDSALVITTKKLLTYFSNTEVICTEDPRELFIKLVDFFDKEGKYTLFSSYVGNKKPIIDTTAIINPRAVVEEGVCVGKKSVVSAGCVLKKGTVIGENCIIRENSIIGCDGISLYKTVNNHTLRFPHIAGVEIGDNVEIGANTVIARGTLANTVIKDETVIGNLCNIGHGVKIGKKVWMSIGTLIGGNCIIGDYTTIGLGAKLRDNLKIGSDVSIGMGSVVTKNLSSNTSVFGNPAKKFRTLVAGPKR